MRVTRLLPWLTTLLVALAVTLESSPLHPAKTAAAAETPSEVGATPLRDWQPATTAFTRVAGHAAREVPPKVVLMRSGAWFVYPHGCTSPDEELDVVVHFHGAPETVIPRYVRSALGAVLVIVNKGLGSGPYEKEYALASRTRALLDRIEQSVAQHCAREHRPIGRLALSSWSAGYGAVQQFLRFVPDRVDAVLLADGLHVGFENRFARVVDDRRLSAFFDFAERAQRGERLLAITHSAIAPMEYAGAGETARSIARHVGAVETEVDRKWAGMHQLSEAKRGKFSVAGFAGNDKAAHSAHLYGVGKTSFAALREHWRAQRK